MLVLLFGTRAGLHRLRQDNVASVSWLHQLRTYLEHWRSVLSFKGYLDRRYEKRREEDIRLLSPLAEVLNNEDNDERLKYLYEAADKEYKYFDGVIGYLDTKTTTLSAPDPVPVHRPRKSVGVKLEVIIKKVLRPWEITAYSWQKSLSRNSKQAPPSLYAVISPS